MSEMLYFTVFLDHLKNTGIYCVLEKHVHKTPSTQRIQRFYFPWQQAAKRKNTDIHNVSAQWFFQKKALVGPFLASEGSQNKEPSAS